MSYATAPIHWRKLRNGLVIIPSPPLIVLSSGSWACPPERFAEAIRAKLNSSDVVAAHGVVGALCLGLEVSLVGGDSGPAILVDDVVLDMGFGPVTGTDAR